ncbi:MAG TPA: 30S ribosomal protein S13 [Candidatus Acidoferrales bacterium]|nr:30S ribosomal protein S13 [Candidatus Acidoferrales bacterium]
MAENKEEAQNKEQKQEKPEGQGKEGGHGKQKREINANVSSIVRVAGKDVNGSLNMQRALSKVKGIGMNMSRALSLVIEEKLAIPRSTEIGTLSEKQMEDVEAIIKEPASAGIPDFMLNRNKDMETGKTMHFVSNDLMFATRQDIARDVTLKDWRGHKHQYGQKVRGQRTRSTGRTGVTVGVTKKAIAAAAKPATAGAPGAEKKK